MSDRQDGGPAFPCAQDVLRSDEGMSLRDYFAGQALTGMLGDSIRTANMGMNIGNDWMEAEMSARWAYKLADAMLAERGKR